MSAATDRRRRRPWRNRVGARKVRFSQSHRSHTVVNQAVTQLNPPGTSTTSPSQNPLQRLLSLDVVRGITICFMIMVNNNGGAGSWGFMNHAQWNGLTPTDLVFPTFVFV